MIKGQKLNLTPEQKEQRKITGRMGGLAKRGSKSKHVIDREKALEMAKDIIAGRTRKLIDTQSMLAIGTIKIFRIDSYYEGKKKVSKPPKLVDDDDEIAKVLDWEYGNRDVPPHTDTEFYFVTTKDPENQAINSLLDRTYGKSTEKSETKLTGQFEIKAITILAPGQQVIKVKDHE